MRAKDGLWVEENDKKAVDFLGLKDCRRIVDLGCGAGMWTSTLRRLTPSGAMIIGLDRDAEACRKASKNLRGRVELVLAEASLLPFKTGCFDLVTCRRLLINLRPRIRRRVVHEMIRVAVTGGTVAAVETSSQANSANQFSSVSGSLRFSKRLQEAMSGTDFDFGAKAAQLLLSCGLGNVKVWAYTVLHSVLPPRYGKVDLHSLVHSGGFVDALRTAYARPHARRGKIWKQLRRQAKRLEQEMRMQIAKGRFVSVSVIPVFVTRGTKPAPAKPSNNRAGYGDGVAMRTRPYPAIESSSPTDSAGPGRVVSRRPREEVRQTYLLSGRDSPW